MKQIMRDRAVQIELAALEAMNKAIKAGHIDVSGKDREVVTERLYVLLNQYQEEITELRQKLHAAELKVEALSDER